MDWFGNKVIKDIQRDMARRVTKATIHASNASKKAFSDPPPPSQPGDYPHRDDGELRRSVAWELDTSNPDNPVGRCGTNKVYAKYLETGTKHMGARKMFDEVLEDEQDIIRRILTKG